MVDIREITEEKIFQTLGKGIPMCDLLSEADVNTIKSNSSLDQVIKLLPEKYKDKIPELELIRERQRLNLGEIRDIKKSLGCK